MPSRPVRNRQDENSAQRRPKRSKIKESSQASLPCFTFFRCNRFLQNQTAFQLRQRTRCGDLGHLSSVYSRSYRRLFWAMAAVHLLHTANTAGVTSRRGNRRWIGSNPEGPGTATRLDFAG